MQCKNQDHQNAPITRICLMKQCPKKKQLLCGECVLQDHQIHSQHCISVKELLLRRDQFKDLLKQRPFQIQSEIKLIHQFFEEYMRRINLQINQLKDQIMLDIQSLQDESILEQDIALIAEDLQDEDLFLQKISNIRNDCLNKISNSIDELTQMLFGIEKVHLQQPSQLIQQSSKLQAFFEANRLKLQDIPNEYKLIRGFLVQQNDYVGESFENKKQGRGYLILEQCYIDGIFVNDQMIWGRKFQYDQDGQCYYLQGEIKQLEVVGKGILKTKSEIYEGDLVDGQRNGQGIANSTGLCYEGEWKDNLRNGYGIEYYDTGDWNGRLKYEGLWVNDKKQGQGVLYYENGTKYEGQWNNNIAQGQGKLIYSNGAMEEGEFSEGLPEGNFNYYSSSGQLIKTNHYIKGQMKVEKCILM